MSKEKYLNLDYKLSKNFSLWEFKVSKSYPKIAEAIEFEYEDVLTLKLLCFETLQPIRDKWGPINILSGKRSDELNSNIGGSKNSDHLSSSAADFYTFNFEPSVVFNWIVEKSGLDYRQVIYYPEQRFIHISINTPKKELKHHALVKIGAEYLPYETYYKELKL